MNVEPSKQDRSTWDDVRRLADEDYRLAKRADFLEIAQSTYESSAESAVPVARVA